MECPKDPNYRTNLNIVEEAERVENINYTKRLNIDSNI